MCRASELYKLSKQARQLLQRASRTSMYIPVENLQSFDGQVKYMFLAIHAARFFLRELHSVLRDKLGVRLGIDDIIRTISTYFPFVVLSETLNAKYTRNRCEIRLQNVDDTIDT
jgi:hypothetical protein